MFDKQSYSRENTKNPLLKPLLLKMPQLAIMDKIIPYLEENGFENITPNREFFEIFAMKGMYEITFFAVSNHDGTTTLSVQVVTERFLGGAGKVVKMINEDLHHLFEK